jgi:hypothetical protein
MKPISAVVVVVLALFLVTSAHADVWKWVDANGDTRFVDTVKPIFTWLDENGEVHYSDSPDHEDAVSVEFVWHSEGSLEDIPADQSGSADPEYADESEAERLEREQAERYYCEQAKQIYASYLNAPRLFRTNDAGEREYLDGKEAAAMIAETRERKDELCAGL